MLLLLLFWGAGWAAPAVGSGASLRHVSFCLKIKMGERWERLCA